MRAYSRPIDICGSCQAVGRLQEGLPDGLDPSGGNDANPRRDDFVNTTQ